MQDVLINLKIFDLKNNFRKKIICILILWLALVTQCIMFFDLKH